ncbi:MAG: tetratricopeptide repeat protein [Anaerolineae bacterium]|nr:tetratricopeptide repeat protein [Anaerolineae bacterium]
MRPIVWVIAACLFIFSAGGLLAQSTETDPEECDEPAIQSADPTYYIGLGDSRFARKDFAGAVMAYTCAIKLDSTYASTFAKRGYAYAALLDSEAALADYDHALELDETLVAAYNNRGTLYTRLGNFGLAINDFTLVIALDPENAIAFNNRGIVHAAEGNFDLAIADFQEAIRLDDTYSTPHASLAAVYSALAAESYQTFVKIAGRNARLPAGTPGEVLTAVDDSLRDGSFSVWLPLLTPAE